MSDQTTIKAGFAGKAFTITALTNLHPGSGKNNYGVIDNLVQRDSLTAIPTINASSLKGALREYCSATWGKKDAKIRHIFGADTKEEENSQGGAYIFMAAQLLSLPVRSDVRPFFRATCPMLIHDFLSTLSSFGISLSEKRALESLCQALQGDAVHFLAGQGAAAIEDLELEAKPAAFGQLSEVAALLGDHPVLLSDEKFLELTGDENLPIIARNNLENGISQNLWYEQILPRQTRFATVILAPTDDPYQNVFANHLQAQPVQIGANASIGYGFCHFKTPGA